MILPAICNLETSVNLLQKHYSRQLMGESHFRHGQFKAAHFFYFGIETVGAADYKRDCAAALNACRDYELQ